MKRPRRVKAIALAAILLPALLVGRSARADVIDVNPFTIATAVDSGQQDGIFDLFLPGNLGSVINNGFTSFSTAAEFDLSSVPAGAILNSATLLSRISNHPFENCPAFCVDRGIEVLGYAGDGTIQLADFGLGGVVGNSVIGVGDFDLAYDVTTFIGGLRSSGTTFAGFSWREEPAGPNSLMGLSVTPGPTLSISFGLPVAVPAAATSVLLLAGLGLLTACDLLRGAIAWLRARSE